MIFFVICLVEFGVVHLVDLFEGESI